LRGRLARRRSVEGFSASNSASTAPSPVSTSSKAKACWSASSFSELRPKRARSSCLMMA